MDEPTFWEPTDEFLNQADYDLKLLVKTRQTASGAGKTGTKLPLLGSVRRRAALGRRK